MCDFKLVYYAVVLAFSLGSLSAQDTSADTCGEGCGCRFGNVQVPARYIESKIATALAEANCKSEISI